MACSETTFNGPILSPRSTEGHAEESELNPAGSEEPIRFLGGDKSVAG